ncbi:MAG: carboxypeptidase, partial [Methylococcaceae bacterium]|nr:carboxypeptidase [Methylococcaceae bacterium]
LMSVRHALRDSVNLVFIRLMRDLVYHHLYKPEGIARWLESPDDSKRKEYLQRFADKEGSTYLNKFYNRYQGKTAEESLDMLTKRVYAKPSRLTMLYRAVYPDHDEMALIAYLNAHLPKTELANEDIYELYDKYSIEKFDLQDQGYITKIHPLELWLVGYLAQNPKATRDEVMAASAEQRQQVYRWLFKNNRKVAQQQRIMTLLETEAFKEIHRAWKRVGYPFGKLTSSYATSIGASGDRPAALAELTGILLNDGIKLPFVRFESLHYAQGTPYETIMDKTPDQGQRIFAPEIAKVARGAMIGVVDGGTAGRLNGIYTDAEGKPLVVGGKTGTGDHRIESKFISRAAVFTFFLGDRFFGVITAYVQGENAGNYHFTSSLPVQIVKFLKPTLSPLINNTPRVNEIAKPVANVIIAENVNPVITETNNKKAKPVIKVASTKKAKLVIKEATVKVIKPSVKEAAVKVTKPVVKEATVKVTKTQVKETAAIVTKQQVKEAAVKVTKPLVKESTAIVTKPQVKETAATVTKPPVKQATAKVTKPLANVALTKNTKPSVNEKITTTDKNDSETRYYKYPTTPKPPL